jgi:hypothetical protein
MNEHFPDQEKLREDLREVLGETPEPSAKLRASVLDYAGRRGRRAPAPRWRIPAAAVTMAAAAALVLMVTQQRAPETVFEAEPVEVEPLAQTPRSAAPAEKMLLRAAPAALEGDLNGDGRIDILDAWRLSRAMGSEQGQSDLNADGEVSPDDLETLMQQIVAVRGGAS